jgi:hypothetical protein
VSITSVEYAGSSNVEREREQNAASARIEVLDYSFAASCREMSATPCAQPMIPKYLTSAPLVEPTAPSPYEPA